MRPFTETARRLPLRLWPGVVIVVVQWLVRFVIPVVAPDAAAFGVVGGVGLGLALVVWWLLFSRAVWAERVGAIVLMVLAVLATLPLVHPSISGGMMGMMLVVYSIPVLGLALVLWAVITRGHSDRVRRTALVAAIVAACLPWTLVRTAGVIGAGSEFHWRWSATPEERLLAADADEPALRGAGAAVAAPSPEAAGSATATPDVAADEPASPSGPADSESAGAVAEAATEWPGFRGPHRDSVVAGVRVATDWSASPPVELWRRPIGPGWSSFAVRGSVIYTQEQRGEEEVVSAYDIATGDPLWRHRDPVRFWESNGGAGPRATPTVSGTRVFTLGATGVLNAFDAATGSLAWSRNAAADAGIVVPDWGIAASPLVVDDLVIVALSGALAAYDRATGSPRWERPSKGGSYSSPHLMSIDGTPQVVLLSGSGATSVAPADGTTLWEHAWPGSAIVQPAAVDGGDILVSTMGATGGLGMRRLGITRGAGGWAVHERWTSSGLKPYFNDYVVHQGHAYGFDGSILASIDLADGTRKWKGGRYGNGQLILLADQDLLMVLSEEGELALVGATPDQFTEVARFPVLNGKTWNHPVVAGRVLLVRNGEEMAAFRLPAAPR